MANMTLIIGSDRSYLNWFTRRFINVHQKGPGHITFAGAYLSW